MVKRIKANVVVQPTTPVQEKAYMTPAEYAKRLRTSRTKLYDMFHTAGCPVLLNGNRFLVPVAEMDAWINQVMRYHKEG